MGPAWAAPSWPVFDFPRALPGEQGSHLYCLGQNMLAIQVAQGLSLEARWDQSSNSGNQAPFSQSACQMLQSPVEQQG